VSDGQLDSAPAPVTLIVTLPKEARAPGRPGKSTTITLHSSQAPSPAPREPERYIVLRGAKPETKSEAKPEAPPIPKTFLTKKEDEDLTPNASPKSPA
jgi:hypothetical protein